MLKNRACVCELHLLLSNDPILDSFAKEAGGQNGECQKTLYEGIFSSQCCHADLLMMSFVFSQQHWPTHHHTILLLLLTALISSMFVVTVDFLWWFWLLTIMAAVSFEKFICLSHNCICHVHIILEWFKSWVAHLRGLCRKKALFMRCCNAKASFLKSAFIFLKKTQGVLSHILEQWTGIRFILHCSVFQVQFSVFCT